MPTEPGRIRRALERAADVLAAETVAVVYAAVVAAPFILLGAVLASASGLPGAARTAACWATSADPPVDALAQNWHISAARPSDVSD